MPLIHVTLKLIGLLIFSAPCLFAFDGHITPSRYNKNEIVIFAKTVKLEESVFGQVMKDSDFDDDRPFWIPLGESIELDQKTVEDFYFVQQVVPRHQAKLYQSVPNPSVEEKNAAENKDTKEKTEIIKSMKTHLIKQGLKKKSEKDHIVYYYSGRAKMKVMKSLKGSLKPGDEIEITWDRIRMRIPCPPLRPVKGKHGWILNKSESSNGSYVLAHGFTDWDNATKIAMAQKKAREQGNTDQPATVPESTPEDNQNTNPELKKLSQ